MCREFRGTISKRHVLMRNLESRDMECDSIHICQLLQWAEPRTSKLWDMYLRNQKRWNTNGWRKGSLYTSLWMTASSMPIALEYLTLGKKCVTMTTDFCFPLIYFTKNWQIDHLTWLLTFIFSWAVLGHHINQIFCTVWFSFFFIYLFIFLLRKGKNVSCPIREWHIDCATS